MGASTETNDRKAGPITKSAVLIAGKNRDLYSIQRGLADGSPAWVLSNETWQSRVGPYSTWERIYEFFEFYKREQIYEVVEL